MPPVVSPAVFLRDEITPCAEMSDFSSPDKRKAFSKVLLSRSRFRSVMSPFLSDWRGWEQLRISSSFVGRFFLFSFSSRRPHRKKSLRLLFLHQVPFSIPFHSRASRCRQGKNPRRSVSTGDQSASPFALSNRLLLFSKDVLTTKLYSPSRSMLMMVTSCPETSFEAGRDQENRRRELPFSDLLDLSGSLSSDVAGVWVLIPVPTFSNLICERPYGMPTDNSSRTGAPPLALAHQQQKQEKNVHCFLCNVQKRFIDISTIDPSPFPSLRAYRVTDFVGTDGEQVRGPFNKLAPAKQN